MSDVVPVELIEAGDKVVADGLIIREQAFRNKQEAVEAAGLSD